MLVISREEKDKLIILTKDQLDCSPSSGGSAASYGETSGAFAKGMSLPKNLENTICIEVLNVKGKNVKLGISAPDDVFIYRKELYERIAQ